MRRLILMLALAAALLAALTVNAAAAARPPVSIGVAPSKIQANLIPGQLYKTDLDIFNKGATPITLDVYLQDYTVSAASAVAFKPPGSLAESAAPWSTLNRRVLHMPAHSHRQVLLRVDVPATAAGTANPIDYRLQVTYPDPVSTQPFSTPLTYIATTP